ncbi:hypothetical protein BZA70DRAFT_270505 [Myxozyma melibiosi]|uniref:Shugoshin C-terminal domain-containing protein n=1 Tax=Myxozyma melibiosi TaxID=54550 RepID=A0ABR1FB84_9ASCO
MSSSVAAPETSEALDFSHQLDEIFGLSNSSTDTSPTGLSLSLSSASLIDHKQKELTALERRLRDTDQRLQQRRQEYRKSQMISASQLVNFNLANPTVKVEENSEVAVRDRDGQTDQIAVPATPASATTPATTTTTTITTTTTPPKDLPIQESKPAPTPRTSSLGSNGNTYTPSLARNPQAGTLAQQPLEEQDESSTAPPIHNPKTRPSSSGQSPSPAAPSTQTATSPHTRSPSTDLVGHSRTSSSRSMSSDTPDGISSRKSSTGNSSSAAAAFGGAMKGLGWKKHKQIPSEGSSTYTDSTLNTPPDSPGSNSRKVSTYGRKMRNISTGSASDSISQAVAEGIRSVPLNGYQNDTAPHQRSLTLEDEGASAVGDAADEKSSSRKVSLGKGVPGWMKRGRVSSSSKN